MALMYDPRTGQYVDVIEEIVEIIEEVIVDEDYEESEVEWYESSEYEDDY